MKEVAHNIYAIDANYFQKGFCCVYLVVENNKALIIDCGTSNSANYIEKALQELNLRITDLEVILVTHVHLDHSAGAGTLLKKSPTAKLWAHPRSIRHLIDPTILIESTATVYKETVESLFGEILPCPKENLAETKNNQIIDFYGRKLQIHNSPGHAKHHFSVFDLKEKIYFAGDSAGVCYPNWSFNKLFAFPPTSPTQFEPVAWKNTLKEIRQFNPQKICITHFGAVTETEELLKQIEHNLDKFTALALKHKDSQNKKETLFSAINDFFVTNLLTQKPALNKQDIESWFKNDCVIASRGLEHWLSKTN